jgi:hypothetical protein
LIGAIARHQQDLDEGVPQIQQPLNQGSTLVNEQTLGHTSQALAHSSGNDRQRGA